jgi:hypothetical protein
MKSKYSIFIMSLALSFLIGSCSKDTTQSNHDVTKCNDPSCSIPNQGNSKTYYIDANQWSGQGPFGCDFGQALKDAAGGYYNISTVTINDGLTNYDLENGKTIGFMGGKLSLSGTYLSFSSYYNQLPFKSLQLEVIVN